ncbi:hypothetical protein M885DRAFT_617671 [Pelagophyceae sp. CCMP2097]|nr:hypothetical protein M885DRAFT_617671 [Pelagophyceae sp. CCMP2097]
MTLGGGAHPEAQGIPSRSSRSLVANVLTLSSKPVATPEGPPVAAAAERILAGLLFDAPASRGDDYGPLLVPPNLFLRSPQPRAAPKSRLLRTFGDIEDLLSPREPEHGFAPRGAAPLAKLHRTRLQLAASAVAQSIVPAVAAPAQSVKAVVFQALSSKLKAQEFLGLLCAAAERYDAADYPPHPAALFNRAVRVAARSSAFHKVAAAGHAELLEAARAHRVDADSLGLHSVLAPDRLRAAACHALSASKVSLLLADGTAGGALVEFAPWGAVRPETMFHAKSALQLLCPILTGGVQHDVLCVPVADERVGSHCGCVALEETSEMRPWGKIGVLVVETPSSASLAPAAKAAMDAELHSAALGVADALRHFVRHCYTSSATAQTLAAAKGLYVLESRTLESRTLDHQTERQTVRQLAESRTPRTRVNTPPAADTPPAASPAVEAAPAPAVEAAAAPARRPGALSRLPVGAQPEWPLTVHRRGSFSSFS